MSLTCFVYTWVLLVKNDKALIIGFGYDEKDNKTSIVIDDLPLYKYSKSLKFNFNTHLSKKKKKKKKILSKRSIRHYLDGE